MGLARVVARSVLATVALVGVVGLAWTLRSRATPATAPERPNPRVARAAGEGIACLGRIQPEDGLVHLSARSISGQRAIVATLLVKEGDEVKRGQVVAVLNSRDQLAAAANAAEARVAVADTRLAQIKAGPKPADLRAQRAEIARLEAESANSLKDFQRFESLSKAGAASPAELDAYRLRRDASASLLAQARERLSSLSDVRDVDVAYAEAEVQAAIRAASQARAELEQADIRSPIDGHVIAIHARPGEEVGEAGIMALGKTDRMYAIAEVDESDVPLLKVGQRATVTGNAITGSLSGVVEYIGLAVTKNAQTSIDPVALTDARVVEAKIRLDEAVRAARLINAQVTVLIAR